MATAVLPSQKPNLHTSDPFHMPSSADASTSRRAAASSSRHQPSSSQLSTSPPAESRPRTFSRLRTSLENTLRTTSRLRSKPSVDEVGALTMGKGKERATASAASSEDVVVAKERSKSSMLSKVSFRRASGKEPSAQSAAATSANGSRVEADKVERDRDKGKVREAGHTSFEAPSLRQASMSSPAIHLSSQPFPSPYSQSFALPAASSSNVSVLVSPTRERSKKVNGQGTISTRDISGPLPLASKRDSSRASGAAPTAVDQKSPKHRPPPVSIQLANAGYARERTSFDSQQDTPTRRTRTATRASDTTPPSPSPRTGQLAATASRRAAASTSHLPLNENSPGSPSTPRPLSPAQTRSPSRTPTHRTRPLASASASHLPLSSPTSSTPQARRPSGEISRVSIERSPSRGVSPTRSIRPRAASPPQRNYSPTLSRLRSVNPSTSSLAAATTNTEQRELVRNASSLLIKEMLKPPSQIRDSGLDPKDYEEVEVRLRSLARLERVWGKSGSGFMTSTQLTASGSTGLSASGEERERRHFGEALRDGYVLCQLVNKLHPGLIPRVDKREDGFVRTSNVTKFLAACSSLGVPPEELFHRDDLIESTPDSMARVAKSIIALLRVSEFPPVDRSKSIQGQGPHSRTASTGPYGQGTLSRAVASTPNLSSAQRSASPPALNTPVHRKRVSPTQPPTLPTVRSDSPNESDSEGSKTAGNLGSSTSDGEADDVLPIPPPPPRSPLRPRSATATDRSSVADSTRASVGDSIRASFAESLAPPSPMRQSLASSHMTEYTAVSSLLDQHRSRRNSESQNSRFGTLRTVNTEATSFVPSEHPSLNQNDAKTLAEEMSRRRSLDSARPPRERRPSETAIVDLTRVVEEAEDSSSSAKATSRTKHNGNGNGAAAASPPSSPTRPKLSAIRLGKGKWPDDFLDAFPVKKDFGTAFLDEDDLRPPSPQTSRPQSPQVSRPQSPPPHSPLSISPPRKLAIQSASRVTNAGSVESLPQFNRRPSHRSRHSVDAPGLLPKSDALLRRDSSPDGSSGGGGGQVSSGSPRIMVRRSNTRAVSGPSNRNGIYIPREPSSSAAAAADSPTNEEPSVPFPSGRTSNELSSTPPQAQGVHFPPDLRAATKGSSTSGGGGGSESEEQRPRMPRGRFQSEIDGASARRKPRPQSYDDAGAKPRRSRFESMVNLGGVGSANASASDLMPRNEGSAVRQTLIVKEDGKPSTQFQLGNCIGRGQFGAVYRALNLNTGQMVAVKRIGLDGLKEDEISQLMKEVDLVKSLSHPSIVKYEGMARDENTLSIVLEYAENGSLGQTLKAFGKLNERLVAGYVVKILEGLHYLHQSDVVHCDLKAANILTTKNGNVKLSDFGVSLNLRAMEREMKDVAGTPNWMAPEVIELKGASTKSDIWSLGCTVIELLTGRPPYGDIANSMSVMFRIVEDDMPPIPVACSDLLKDFLRQCFHKEPSKRPSADVLCEHEWLKQNWAAHNKEIRPQDSIPFLRRVSADLQKSEAIKYLAKIEMHERHEVERSTPEGTPPVAGVAQVIQRRLSNDAISPREHSFVKTTFSKPVICRVCHTNVKRSAVLCEQCSLIAHARCAHHAPQSCDLRSQLLLYAQYAESGTPNSAYSNPLEFLHTHAGLGTPSTPMSDAGMSSRTSVDASVVSSTSPPPPPAQSPPPASNHHPPTAFKVLSAFKRSRSFLKDSDVDHSSTSSPSKVMSRKTSILRRNPPPPAKERPSSVASVASTTPPMSSLRSAVTASDSLHSRPDTVRQSAISIVETDISVGERTDPRLSRMTSFSGMSIVDAEEGRIPGDLPPGSTREKKRESKGDKSGCLVQ